MNATGHRCVVAGMAHFLDYRSRGKEAEHDFRSTTYRGFLGQHTPPAPLADHSVSFARTSEQLPRDAVSFRHT